jgi:hypothetical protein
MKAWTDYPFPELGDTPGMKAPIRECRVISYDWNKYCRIKIGERVHTVKICYVYRKPGRCGEVPAIDEWKTERADGRPYWKYHKRRVKKTTWAIISADGDWTDFETKREAVRKSLAMPVGARLYRDSYSNGRTRTSFELERIEPKSYRMKRRY